MTTKKIKKPTIKQYKDAYLETAEHFSPRIFACQKCGWPVATGYCCVTCGDANPYEKEPKA